MTKLQTIIAEIKSLPPEDQQVVISELAYLIPQVQEEYIFSDEEWAEIEDRIKNDTVTFSVEEVMTSLRERHETDSTTK